MKRLIACAGACVLALSAAGAPKASPGNRVAVESFLKLGRGTSLENVRAVLKMPGKHEFSVLVDQVEYLCLSFDFEEPRVRFYLVFTNKHLKAVADPVKAEYDRVPYERAFREVEKPFEPEQRVQSVLSSQHLNRQQLEQRILATALRGSKSWNVLPAFIITAPLFAARAGQIEADYRKNAEFARKYDPLKIRLGTSLADVSEAFGKPYRIIKKSTEEVVHVYGDPMPLRVNPKDRFSWVAVVIENGKAVRVFSNQFLDKRLLESQP